MDEKTTSTFDPNTKTVFTRANGLTIGHREPGISFLCTRSIFITALCFTMSALGPTAYANSLLLTPARTQFEWQGWTITIQHIAFKKAVKQSYGVPKIPDADSEFVYLDVTVKNSSHRGQSFVPQNEVKIIVGDDAFDAEDIDDNSDYVKNIEPTLARQRECYFELPKALIKDAFLLRFSRLFTDSTDVPVTIAVSNLTEGDETRGENDLELSKIPARESSPFSVMKPEVPTPEVDYFADNASAEMQLNLAWSRLSGRQRNQLRQDERAWIARKDAIPSVTQRTGEVRSRTQYLLSFSNH